jgi:nitroreductase
VESQEGKSAVQKAYERDWFKTAPLYIVAVIEHSESWKRKTDNKDHGEIDIAIAVEHICLAAAEKGLGTCWVCNFEPQIIKDFLKLSDTQEPAVLIPLGHISKDFQQKEKQRKTLKEIVF